MPFLSLAVYLPVVECMKTRAMFSVVFWYSAVCVDPPKGLLIILRVVAKNVQKVFIKYKFLNVHGHFILLNNNEYIFMNFNLLVQIVLLYHFYFFIFQRVFSILFCL